jgi:hypothetical protein
MSEDTSPTARRERCGGHPANVSSGIYALAFIGAAVYYLQHSTTFWEGVLGILKAIIWPAMLVYKALEFFKL